MRGFRTPAAALLLLLGLGLAPGAAPAAAQDADSNVDRALQKVEALLSQLRAKSDADPKLVEKLEEVAGDLRKEKEARGGAASSPGAPAMPGGGGGADWIVNETKKNFTKGTELSEDERTTADSVITEFLTDYKLAKDNEDEKSRKVVREHTEGRIARSFPSKTANRLKDNLDGIIKMWEWRGGRGR
jgi:hypothetical protein